MKKLLKWAVAVLAAAAATLWFNWFITPSVQADRRHGKLPRTDPLDHRRPARRGLWRAGWHESWLRVTIVYAWQSWPGASEPASPSVLSKGAYDSAVAAIGLAERSWLWWAAKKQAFATWLNEPYSYDPYA